MQYRIPYLFFLLSSLFFMIGCSDGNDQSAEEKKADRPGTAVQGNDPGTRSDKHIVFFGNSLTAAYGLDPSQGYVSLIQQRIDSLGLPYRTINAGLSGETTAGGRERVSWVLRQPVDIFLLELGGNDALRGIEPSTTYANLEAIIQSVREKYPQAKIILAGMEAPPNMGDRYTKAFRNVYPDLAAKYDLELIPFFLEGVAGVPDLNQADRIHPNKAGQYILRDNVWKHLENVMEEG